MDVGILGGSLSVPFFSDTHISLEKAKFSFLGIYEEKLGGFFLRTGCMYHV